MRAPTSCLLASALLLGIGCTTDDLPSESTSGQTVTTSNRLSYNRIATNRIATNRIATNRIATNRIATNALGSSHLSNQTLTLDAAAVAELLAGEDGELILEYLISCAFPSSVTFVGPGADGEPRTYPGNLGLAPFWATRQLTNTEKGWLSACMLARVNLYEIPLMISLRGPHAGLTTTAAEEAEFDVEEGAFYGDIFTGDEPIKVFACRGLQQGDSTDLAERACTQAGDQPGETACEMISTGDCALACEERFGVNADNAFYERCHDRPTNNPKQGWAGSDRYDQVITVFLR